VGQPAAIQEEEAMMKHGKNRFVFMFLAIPVFLYTLFVLLPYFGAMAMSLTRWTGVSTLDKVQFRGLQNFQRILTDEKFWNALSHNLIVLLVLPIITLSIALLFAGLFTQGLKGSKFFRIVFFFPQVMSVAVVAILWSFVFHPTMGILNGIIGAITGLFGVRWPAFPWLGNISTVLPSVILVAIWQAVGFYMVLFVAGMQSIPDEYYEAAKIDGANGWTQFWKITIPLLWETIRTAVVFLSIAAMDMFAYVTILTNGTGGPSRAGDVLSTYMYDQAFGGGNSSNPFGYGTAIGVVLLFIILGLSLVSLRLTKREVLEY
jgi:N-acetylglucosamine transport system permease protein